MTLFDMPEMKCKMCGKIVKSCSDFRKVHIIIEGIKKPEMKFTPVKVESFYLCADCKNDFVPPFHFK